jgi:hypothetical protein
MDAAQPDQQLAILATDIKKPAGGAVIGPACQFNE